jgi:hypothetical protein
MAKSLRHPDEFRPFNRWVNGLRKSELDPERYQLLWTDIDGIVMRNVRQPTPKELWTMILEVKTFGNQRLTPSNVSAMDVLKAALERLHGTVTRIRMWGATERRRVLFFGVHVLTLSHDRPDTSDWMEWDGRRITIKELIKLLRFELDPNKLTPFPTREHAHTPATP